MIKEYTSTINCLIQLKNKIIALWDSTIKLFKIKKTKYKIIQTGILKINIFFFIC